MVNGYAATAVKSQLTPFTYELDAPGSQEVLVEVEYCGICHSDIHLIDDDWGMSEYPLVPGHEIVGRVVEMGKDVKGLSKGQRVGIGWQCGSCHHCDSCLSGNENVCPTPLATAAGHYGGFAEKVCCDRRFVFPLPEALDSVAAAPLMCGGITVYSPFRLYNVTANQRVGVVGIGGLGHLALQFADAMGCEVTAFSSSASKAEEAAQFGADHFVSSIDKDRLATLTRSLDFILVTACADLDWNIYLDLLKPDGKLCFVGLPDQPISINAFGLIVGRRSVCGSCIGSPVQIREMLDFAARHNIQAQTETMPLAEVNAAIDKVRNNKARYRMVLEI